jgi:hypothetical protein
MTTTAIRSKQSSSSTRLLLKDEDLEVTPTQASLGILSDLESLAPRNASSPVRRSRLPAIRSPTKLSQPSKASPLHHASPPSDAAGGPWHPAAPPPDHPAPRLSKNGSLLVSPRDTSSSSHAAAAASAATATLSSPRDPAPPPRLSGNGALLRPPSELHRANSMERRQQEQALQLLAAGTLPRNASSGRRPNSGTSSSANPLAPISYAPS